MNRSCEVNSQPKGWSAKLRSWYFWKPIVGFLIGSVAGLLYYYYYSIESHGSSVTGDPLSNALFGGMIGLFIVKRPCSTC